MLKRETRLEHRNDYWAGAFQAMGGPCELLAEAQTHREASKLLDIAATEAWRIEEKFSRYRKDNIIHKINRSNGVPVEVDEETSRLLNYAAGCYEMSEGMFDITSGVLRAVWKFDGSDRIPTQDAVAAVLPHIGWDKVTWESPRITLPEGMEIDLGGVGKEYAVDRTAALLNAETKGSYLVNFGGDLFASGLRANGEPWGIGVDDPLRTGEGSIGYIQLPRGGIATSGDARRFLLKDGKRYGHILNPKTGWPVENSPRSVTVAAETCIEAGILSTMATLQGKGAREFLEEQGMKFWVEE
jgi:FAD:protein FMN transferase